MPMWLKKLCAHMVVLDVSLVTDDLVVIPDPPGASVHLRTIVCRRTTTKA